LSAEGTSVVKLEQVQIGTRLRGIAPDAIVAVKSVRWCGEQCLEVVVDDGQRSLPPRLLYRDDEVNLELVEAGRLIGIAILDHVIVARGGYYSFRDAGQLLGDARIEPRAAARQT
jgi:hypothetical protein